jgi:O-antigen/teichoic acid export membrane protein
VALQSTDRPGFSRRINLISLVVGFGVGQGSLFLAQTWLIASGELKLLGLFGFHLTLLVLASQIVDWGGLVILARNALLEGGGTNGWAEALESYWALSFVRLSIAFLFTITISIYISLIDIGFSYSYLLVSVPGLIIWSFNVSGLLDGLRSSGLTGLTIPIPYFVSAIALLFAEHLSYVEAGIVLGAAYLLGIVITVVVQWIILKKLGFPLCYIRPKKALVYKMAKEGAIYLAAFLPGQVLLRIQILFSNLILGIEASGVFIYGKQIINMVNQMVAFVRRVEFPKLVNELEVTSSNIIGISIRVQKLGLTLAFFSGIILWFGTLLILPIIPDVFSDAVTTVSVLSPVIISGVLFSVLNQSLIAKGEFSKAAIATNTVTIVALAISWPLPHIIGFAGFTIAEVSGHFIGIALAIFMYKKGIKTEERMSTLPGSLSR